MLTLKVVFKSTLGEIVSNCRVRVAAKVAIKNLIWKVAAFS